MIHYYYGNGAGKTTSAIGLTLRAADVYDPCVVQFLKDGTSGEISALKKLGIPVFAVTGGVKFFRSMTDEDKARITAEHNENLRRAFEKPYTFIMLDELGDAADLGLCDTDLVKSLLTSLPDTCEAVITGHRPTELFLDIADYVTEFVCHEHPYKKGIAARRGIEY